MKKVILFDWGGVLLQQFATQFSVEAAMRDVEEKFWTMGIFRDSLFWRSSGERLNDVICDYLIDTGQTIVDFKKSYSESFSRIPWFKETTQLVNDLASDNRFCVGLLSNQCEMDFEIIKQHLDVHSLDYCFASFNLGVAKPEAGIYEMVETITGCTGSKILFIDDLVRNTAPAKLRGWQTVTATGNEYEKIRNACYSFMGLE